MATITPVSVPPEGLIAALGATAAGGDEFSVATGDILLYHNGSATPTTVTLVAVATSANVIGGFPVVPANKAFVIPAGQRLALVISTDTLGAYVNATTKRVAVTYVGHDAALKVDILRKG